MCPWTSLQAWAEGVGQASPHPVRPLKNMSPWGGTGATVPCVGLPACERPGPPEGGGPRTKILHIDPMEPLPSLSPFEPLAGASQPVPAGRWEIFVPPASMKTRRGPIKPLGHGRSSPRSGRANPASRSFAPKAFL